MTGETTQLQEPMPDEPGATGSTALAAVTALMEQRRRFEGWIAALDARQDATPAHVFERVHGDYSARLQVVVQELAAHADGLRIEMETLQGKLFLVEQDQQRAQDERAEGELRAHVGELPADDWTAASAASDDRLAELAMARADVEQELTRTRELLFEAERPAARTPDAAEAPVESDGASPRTSGRVSVPSARDSTVHASNSESVAEEPPEIAVESPAVADVPPMELSASVIAAEQQILELEDRNVAEPDAPAAPARSDAPQASSGNRFDELAFLSSVVDEPVGEVESGPSDRPDEKARRNSFAQDQVRDDGIVNLSEKRRTPLDHMKAMTELEHEGDPPFASNVTGNYPIKLTEKPTEGAKTLKCGECSAMNYPTEWYCERCGAELASL